MVFCSVVSSAPVFSTSSFEVCTRAVTLGDTAAALLLPVAQRIRPPAPTSKAHTASNGINRRPIRGATAALTPDTAGITLRDVSEVYESELSDETTDTGPFRGEINGQGGILLAVSHVIDPAADADLGHQVNSAMSDGRMLCGWVALR